MNYNEKEKSSILYAQLINDVKCPDELTLKDKIQAFQAYLNLNSKISKPTFHVSLNPDPDDKLSDEQLTAIGREYLERMNYGQQPFIIYKHEDIERTHIHLVSVSVGLNGKAISTSNDRFRSEEIRKDLEVKYGLIKAGDKIKNRENIFAPINISAIEYGKTDTKSAIAAVVRSATRDYKCTSLTEFKTLLNQYNVTLEEVKDQQEPDKTLGLFYAVINPAGEKVSTRIKASAIDKKVGLTALRDKFNQDEKQIRESNVKALLSQKIKGVLQAYPYITQTDFKNHLNRQGIQTVCRESKENRLYGITFIDTQTKIVLNGRNLGKAFSAHTLNQRFTDTTLSVQDLQKANKHLIRIYNEHRKTDEKFYYESGLIKALPGLAEEFILQLQNQLPLMQVNQARLAVDNFITYRHKQLPKVQEKETGYFKANTPALLDFIQRNQALTLKQKLSFLYANNITFSQKDEDLFIHPAKSQEVGYTVPKTTLFNLFSTPATGEKLAVSASEIPVLDKIDRNIIKVLSLPQEERDYTRLKLADKINFLPRSPLLPYFTSSDKHLLYSHANLNYVDGFFRNLDNGLNYNQTISKILENGLLIKPETNQQGEIISFHIGFYKLPETTFVKAGTKITEYLKANNFTYQTAARMRKLVFRPLQTGEVKISPKYGLIVRLHQALQKNDLKATNHVLSLIHKMNKPLGEQIEKRITDFLKLKNESGHAEKIQAKDLIPVILKEIVGYPADTLREPSQNTPLTNRYSTEAMQGAKLLEGFGQLFNNLADAVFGRESGENEEHKPEQNRRKKRRRPRW
ncbi:MAG: relaxase/mobilization nuclease domain-containing protein [Adhaeribacter sp.]